MQRFLGVVVALLLAAGAVGLVVERGRSPAHRGAPATVPTTAGPTVAVLRPGQVRVSGSVDSASFDGASAAPLRLPFTVTAGQRGATRARITGARQDGQPVTITWDGGQPLPFGGAGGGLDVSGGHLDLDGGGLTWSLDGDPRPLLAGHYELGATVAVGTSGLATPRDRTAFDAGAGCQLSTVNGATVHTPPAAVHLEGPGTLEVRGRLQVETSAGERRMSSVRFGPGSFVADVAPGPDGWAIQLLAEGPLTDRP